MKPSATASTSISIANLITAIACTYLILASAPVGATTREYKTDVLSVLSGDAFGGCMMLVNTMNNALDCKKGAPKGWWVSLDCDGQYGTTMNARESVDQATMSMLLKKKISVRIDDREKIDGYCVAHQTILWR